MGKPGGFLEYERENDQSIAPLERIKNFDEFHKNLSPEKRKAQAARCMECGIPFCQAGEMISGMASGCPLHNLVPETNDALYRGNIAQAYERLSLTHSFPEFTSRVCPALCEAACTCSVNGESVTTKDNEKYIIEYAFEHGLVKAKVPTVRTGRKVAVIGSGPSGLAAAAALNLRGHKVTVYERNDRAGGLLRYGIPNMKLDKRVIDRRLKIMEESGIEFKFGADVGKNVKAGDLLKEYDRVVLACGASNPRDINAPGRDAKGIYFAVDFLKEVSKKLMDENYDVKKLTECKTMSWGNLKGKNVVIIGGGDTGNDCVGTSVRLGAGSVIQLEMMPKPPVSRTASNPWPEWPKILKTDYGQEEAIAVWGRDPRIYQTTVTEFVKDKDGRLKEIKTVKLEPQKDFKTGRMNMIPVKGSEEVMKADLVLIAAGFLGSQDYVVNDFGVDRNPRTNVATEEGAYVTSKDKVFVCGDMHRGQSLVVWAIAEGRAAAKAVDESLMGYSNL